MAHPAEKPDTEKQLAQGPVEFVLSEFIPGDSWLEQIAKLLLLTHPVKKANRSADKNPSRQS